MKDSCCKHRIEQGGIAKKVEKCELDKGCNSRDEFITGWLSLKVT